VSYVTVGGQIVTTGLSRLSNIFMVPH